MAREKYPGVIQAETRDGGRWRASVSIAGFRPVYGGTFRTLDEAIDMSDAIRFWAHRLSLTARPPKLVRPERFTDDNNLPECHPDLHEFHAAKTARETPAAVVRPLSFSDLIACIDDLQARVAALESAGSKPKTIDLKTS